MRKGPFKMKGFSGFQNSPMKKTVDPKTKDTGNQPYVRTESDSVTQFELAQYDSPEMREGGESKYRLRENKNVLSADDSGRPGTYSTPNLDKLANMIQNSEPGEKRNAMVKAWRRAKAAMESGL